MNKQQNQQINRIKHNQGLLKPHQLVRFNRWLGHFERTGEYLAANFFRLESSIAKAKARSRKTPFRQVQASEIIEEPKRITTTIIYKRRRNYDQSNQKEDGRSNLESPPGQA